MKTDTIPQLLCIDEVAKILRLSTTTIRRWERLKIIIPIRINSRVIRYKREDILNFIAKRNQL